MHATALKIGAAFFRNYLANAPLPRVLDVGGMNINGSLRSVAPTGADYLSIDAAAGPGVDLVLDDPYSFPFADNAFDATVSTSCFEHDAMFWLSFLEMCRVTRDGGYIYLNAPSAGSFHRYPVDCWRFYPDAGLALTQWARRSGYDVAIRESFIAIDFEDVWRDFVCVFRKGTAAGRPAFLHSEIACDNVQVEGSTEILRLNGEMQDGRELRQLRRALGLDETRSALKPG